MSDTGLTWALTHWLTRSISFRPRRQTDVERRERTAAAFSSITAAEIQPTMGHARRAA
jgi:hypothetical protein